MENYPTDSSSQQSKKNSCGSFGKLQFNDERGVKTFGKVDYLEVTMSHMSPYSNSSKQHVSADSIGSQTKTFVVMDYSTILPTRITVGVKEAETLTVDWLFNEYIKRQTQNKNVRFDVGNLVCLKTRMNQVQYDYVLTHPNASLSLFPDEIILETYHSKPVSTVDFSSFEILGLVGQGGYGTVLAARKVDTGKIYAMKVIAKSRFQRTQSEVYVFGEKNILMELAHPYVTKVDYIFQSNKYIFFVMDLHTGGDLFAILQKHPLMREEQARPYIVEIIQAIDYLHEEGILYRDLKPENVMLDWMGHIKLVDFGLSKKLDSKKTRTYSFVGSEGYASPEIMSKKPHNYLTDLYSIGVVLYDMLHGNPPFTKYDPTTKTFKLDRSNVLHIRKSLSESCRRLLFRLLSRSPSERLGSSERTLDILNDPWFDPVRDLINMGGPMEMPFTPKLSDNVLQMEQNTDILETVLADIREDRENSANMKQNRFIGFNYDCTDTTDTGSPGKFRADVSISPVSNCQRLNQTAGLTNEMLNEELDEFEEGVSIGRTSPVRLFKNRTKLTRENNANQFFSFRNLADKYQ